MYRRREIFKAALVTSIVTIANFSCFAQLPGKFYGPFESWANVKTRFNAVGNGIIDDTKAIQLALDSLSNPTTGFNSSKRPYTVLYFPPGHYKVSGTLHLKGKLGVVICGSNPKSTIIDWYGGNNDTMLLCNGSSYFRVSGLGWNANSKEGIECIGIHWLNKWNDPVSRSYAPLNIELSDLNFFGNPFVGIGTGTFGTGTGQNDSEITIRDCDFLNCKQAGIRILGYNALDNWIWNCKFTDCKFGVQNNYGNYHAYYCQFFRSEGCDFLNKDGYYTSVRHCYSVDSRAFSLDEGSSSNPFKRIFQGNTVINPQTIPIEYYHVGALSLYDNYISKSRDTLYPFLVNQKNWAPVTLQLMSIGNQYGYAKMPVRIPNSNKQIYSVDDIVENDQKIHLNKNPGRVVSDYNSGLKILKFEVSKDGTDVEIQKLVNQAVRVKGKLTVIHFPVGRYYLNRTVEIPPNSNILFIGDGLRGNSIILQKDVRTFKGSSLFKISGPASVGIKELQFGFASLDKKFTAIEFENIDQPNDRVSLDQIYSACDTTIFIDGLNYLQIENNNAFFTDRTIINGGQKKRQGVGTLSVHAFGGQYAGVEVHGGGDFVGKDCWWEGPNPLPLNLKGEGNITIDGAKIAPNKGDSSTIIKVDRFRGKLTLANMYIQGGMEILPDNPDLKFLLWNANFYHKKNIPAIVPSGFSGTLAFMGLTAQCFYKNDPDCSMIKSFPNIYRKVNTDTIFIKEMLAMDRLALPQKTPATRGKNSMIFISRVSFDSFAKALLFHQ